MNRLIRATLASLTIASMMLELTGCGGNDSAENPMPTTPNQSQMEAQFNDLMKRPDIDQVTAQYEEMYGQIRAALSSAFPALQWRQTGQLTGSACGFKYSGLDADDEQRNLPNWMAPGSIPDEQWGQALQIVQDIARKNGFADGPIVVKNQPGDHYVSFYDNYSAALTFGSAVNLGFSLGTGCHLTAVAKKRGHPTSTSTAHAK